MSVAATTNTSNDSNYEPADHYSTKIGGLPVYAPISIKDLNVEERIIYIFGFMVLQFDSHLWRALRVQKISSLEDSLPSCDDVDQTTVSSLSISETNWHDELWSVQTREEHGDEIDEDIDLEKLGRALSEAAHVASTSTRQSNDNESSRNYALLLYIHREEKFLRKVASENSKYPLPSIKVYEDNSEDHSNDETYEEETYEYDRALHADRAYLKFKKRVDEYREQCFRFCGELRQYEMQLMPPLIYFFQEATDDPGRTSLEKFDWMTLLVFTCSMASAFFVLCQIFLKL